MSDEIPTRRLAVDMAALITCAILAAIPYGYMMAAEDGLPGDTERIIANSVASSLGFVALGAVLLFWKRKNPKRLQYAIVLVIVLAAFAFSATLRRAGAM